jgi:predicted neuraminidase
MSTQTKIKTIDLLSIALAMSVGWGFRGNYGHEYGAMVPGALVAMAICLASGREDWYRRIAYFGVFGALGWAFTGQMSYGYLIGYTFSMDMVSVAYGFSGIFLNGFLWGGIGAGILALVLILERKKVVEMIFPFLMVFGVWSAFSIYFQIKYGDVEPSVFYYFDTDWMAAVTALLALLIAIAIQRKITHAVSFMLHITIGWIAGLLFFVTLLDWHLNPPRSDNWAGLIGLMIGLLFFLFRLKYFMAIYAALFVAIFGGIGFAVGELFQVVGNSTGVHIDWWKVMEQFFGLIMGLGAAIVFLKLKNIAPNFDEKKVKFDWGNLFAIFFLIVGMTYVTVVHNVEKWIEHGIMAQKLAGISTYFWFAVAYLIFAILVIIILRSSQHRKLAFLPETLKGRGQLLFLLVLWWAIIEDHFKAFLQFNHVTLIVEGSFFISAVLVTLWIVLRQVEPFTNVSEKYNQTGLNLKKVGLMVPITFILSVLILTPIARYSHSKPFGGSHERFKKVVQTDEQNQMQDAKIKTEFIYEEAPFPSCHASTIEETQNGLIAAWFGGTHEKNPDVGIWISRNNGEGWSDVVEVVNGDQGENLRYPTWNPVLFQPKQGPLMLFYKVGPNPGEWWGMLTTSEDGGKTWSNPKRLPNGILGPIKNKPVQLADGTILCGSSTESKSSGWLVYMESTPDLGLTWQKSDSLNDKYDFFAIQPSILSYPDGKLQILCRSKQKRITECWSSNNGKSWSKMRLTTLPNPDAGIDAVSLDNGYQLLIYNHTIKGRSPLNVAISKDGKDWKPIIVLEDQPGEYSYPAVIQTSDGLVHITYTWKREKIKHVVIDPKKLTWK